MNGKKNNDIFIMWYIDMHTHKIDKQHCHAAETTIAPISVSHSHALTRLVTIPLFISI